MPLPKLPEAAELAFHASAAIVRLTGGAAHHALPRLADHAAGDQLAVVTADLLADRPTDATIEAAIEILTALRRALP